MNNEVNQFALFQIARLWDGIGNLRIRRKEEERSAAVQDPNRASFECTVTIV